MKEKTLWGFIYVMTFVVVFAISVYIKITYPKDPMTKIKWDDTVGTIHTDIAYGNGDSNKFDLYVPADTSKESYGLVVYLHAGGFTAGDKSDDASICKYFASKGYVAAAINYTLRTEDNVANVYTMSQEIKQSIPVVKEETIKLGYNLDRMAMAGGSAGGCLALLYAYRDAPQSPIPVKFVFEAVGPPSFETDDWYGLGEDAVAAAEFFSVMTGKAITANMIGTEEYQEAIKDISPYMWIDENSVPTLCAYGKYDKVCPFGTVKHLINALKENNVPHDYIEFPHSGHGLQNDSKQSKLYMEKIDEYFSKYF